MAQDTALLRYLLKGARRAPGSGSQRDLAFAFDGTNDYISSNATIGRTGYDMNVSGNVTTGSDGDGNYINFNGNFRRDLVSGSNALCTSSNTVSISQAASFTLSVKFKFLSFSADNNSSGVFALSGNSVGIYTNNNIGNAFTFRIRGATFTDATTTISIGTLYQGYLVYNQPTNKLYAYLSTSGGTSVLLNSGGTVVSPVTFGGNVNINLGDNGIAGGNYTSSNKYIYHACIRNKALTQSEIDADIALGNATKQDPSIVAYYVPENLQYNTQYMLNPKDLDQSPRAYTGATVTANTNVAPDGTTTADNIVFGAATHRLVQQTITAITGSALASKTFIVKAFVKCTTGTQTFRFRMDHAGVDTNQYSSDFTATTTRQEFTFTRTLTSSTSGTGLFIAVANNSAGTAQTIQVRNVRVYLVNQTLRDESPNIGGFIGRKTQKVLSCWAKPNADFSDTSNSGCLISSNRLFLQERGPSHNLFIRYDDRRAAKTKVYTLGAGYRNKVHIAGVFYWDNGLNKRGINTYINGVLAGGYSGTPTIDAPIALYNSNLWLGRFGSLYFSGNIRDAKLYTFTDSFTDSDAMAIYNGGEPISSGITKYLHYKPPVGEVGTTTEDQSPNDRDGTLNGGVTRDYI